MPFPVPVAVLAGPNAVEYVGVMTLPQSGEYGFALTLNHSGAITVPAYFAGLQGNIEGMPWPQVAAGALVFVAPIVLFTVLVRRHLLRGVTFGTIKQ